MKFFVVLSVSLVVGHFASAQTQCSQGVLLTSPTYNTTRTQPVTMQIEMTAQANNFCAGEGPGLSARFLTPLEFVYRSSLKNYVQAEVCVTCELRGPPPPQPQPRPVPHCPPGTTPIGALGRILCV